ncbi:MAG TPA: glycoside hydrolase family 15 protein, partial [Candidatus Krumholzibacteria bacterium]|nr:glycoside hydrolase family 15 protein [Candidatus Krumholzibacteria bacterium]
MNHAIIGNCQYSALIDEGGAVVWLCWPRFDASFVFGDLLDPDGGRFEITSPDTARITRAYVKNTNILVTRFETARGDFEVIDFAPRFVNYGRMFNPTMLVRIVRPLRGEPTIRVACRPTYDYGRTRPLVHWGSNHLQYDGFPNRLRLTTNSPRTYVHEERAFVLRETQYFVLTWGAPLEAPLADTCEVFLVETRKYWQSWIKHCSMPDRHQEDVIRSALTLKLHQFEDTGAIIAATTTSIPEAPGSGRTWDYRYSWLRDAYFTLSAFRHLGQFEEMERFIDFLRNIMEASPERLQPLYTISGSANIEEHVLDHLRGYRGDGPVRVGNAAAGHVQHDVYGEMILAMEPLFLDQRFTIDDGHRPVRLLARLVEHIAVNLTRPDAGIWEFRSTQQVHTFSLLMHWAGSRSALRVAEALGLDDLATKSRSLADSAAAEIETRCWNEARQCYTQAISSDHVDASLLMMVTMGF